MKNNQNYWMTFQQFLAFVILMNLRTPFIESMILLYLEFLVQTGLKSCSIRNHVSILRHFFQMFNWPKSALIIRKIQLFI